MDEYSSGMEPEVKRYFKQIINSFFIGALWLMIVMIFGLFFGLGLIDSEIHWYNIVFYLFVCGSLAGFVYFLYRTWRKRS